MYSDDDVDGDYYHNSSEEDMLDDNECDDCCDLEVEVSPTPKNYTVLTESDIRHRQAADMTEVSSVLSVSSSAAAILLRRHHWSLATVLESWFSNEAKIRESTGLLFSSSNHEFPKNKKKFTCGICFDPFGCEYAAHAGCGHMFCCDCMESYIRISIQDGPGCLNLRCPDPSCISSIDQDMVNCLVSDMDKKKYTNYLYRSYVEDNLKIKWCPAPGCELAVEFNDVGNNSSYDVSCLCSHRFCWSCMEEAHRPIDCETVTNWILKNSAESENVNWILAYTKPCPQCKKPIEKNAGCMRIACRCLHQFCWLCLNPWEIHGYNPCNSYTPEKALGDNRREMAKKSIMRYTHYYERWAANESSRLKALEDLKNMESVNLEYLKIRLLKPVTELEFVTEAWVQIVECRRALKWSYAYGFYIEEEEKAKRTFFEYLQGEAELGLERLHHCAEKDLQAFLGYDENEPKSDFYSFKLHLITLTKVTRTYFENLVKALENNLEDVNTDSNKVNDEAPKKRDRDMAYQLENQKRQFKNGGS